MENNVQNDTEYPQEASRLDANKLKIILKSKTLMILALVIVLILILFFSVKLLSSEDSIKIIPSPTQALSPTPTIFVKPTLAPFPEEYVRNQLIIEYEEGMSPEDLIDNDEREFLAKKLEALGVVYQDKLSSSDDPLIKNVYVLTFEENIDVEEVASKIYKIPQIKNLEPNAENKIFDR